MEPREISDWKDAIRAREADERYERLVDNCNAARATKGGLTKSLDSIKRAWKMALNLHKVTNQAGYKRTMEYLRQQHGSKNTTNSPKT